MTEAVAVTTDCAWCGQPFEPRRTGGTPQLFCTIAHRRAFDQSARAWVQQAIETGALTIADLQRASRTARALLGQPSDASAAAPVELGLAARERPRERAPK